MKPRISTSGTSVITGFEPVGIGEWTGFGRNGQGIPPPQNGFKRLAGSHFSVDEIWTKITPDALADSRALIILIAFQNYECFSPDAQPLASAGDGTVHLWKFSTDTLQELEFGWPEDYLISQLKELKICPTRDRLSRNSFK